MKKYIITEVSKRSGDAYYSNAYNSKQKAIEDAKYKIKLDKRLKYPDLQEVYIMELEEVDIKKYYMKCDIVLEELATDFIQVLKY